MGSHNLRMEVKASNDQALQKKFEQVRRACEIEYGTNPYNGTWSTVPGVRVVSDPFPGKKWTDKKRREVFSWIEDHTEKYENALAVRTSRGYIVAGWAVS